MFRLNDQNVAYSVLKAAEKAGIRIMLKPDGQSLIVSGKCHAAAWFPILRRHKDELIKLFEEAQRREKKR